MKLTFEELLKEYMTDLKHDLDTTRLYSLVTFPPDNTFNKAVKDCTDALNYSTILMDHAYNVNLTPDEMEKLAQQNFDAFINSPSYIPNPFFTGTFPRFEPEQGFPVECQHIWKEYTGLSEMYKYCEVCDVKDRS